MNHYIFLMHPLWLCSAKTGHVRIVFYLLTRFFRITFNYKEVDAYAIFILLVSVSFSYAVLFIHAVL